MSSDGPVLRLKEGDVMLFRFTEPMPSDDVPDYVHARMTELRAERRFMAIAELSSFFYEQGNGATFLVLPDFIETVQHLETADPLLFALERAGHSPDCVPKMAWGGNACSCGVIPEGS